MKDKSLYQEPKQENANIKRKSTNTYKGHKKEIQADFQWRGKFLEIHYWKLLKILP